MSEAQRTPVAFGGSASTPGGLRYCTLTHISRKVAGYIYEFVFCAELV